MHSLSFPEKINFRKFCTNVSWNSSSRIKCESFIVRILLFLCMTVHVSFSLLIFLHLLLGILSCLGMPRNRGGARMRQKKRELHELPCIGIIKSRTKGLITLEALWLLFTGYKNTTMRIQIIYGSKVPANLQGCQQEQLPPRFALGCLTIQVLTRVL